jgi:hypothetical protein
MLLPSDMTVDWPLLPPLDKVSVTALATLLCCWMKGTQLQRPPRSILIYLLSFGLIIAPFLSSLDNSYELQEGAASMHGFYPLDGLKVSGRYLLLLIPLHISRRFLSTDRARELLLKAFPTATLVYSLPMLFEIRMSPQLHQWVYGYFPGNNFVQQIRGNGFRPVVFLPHGLGLALFVAAAIIAATVLMRVKDRIVKQVPDSVVIAYLSGLLVLCKSLGPGVYAAVFGPLALVTKPRFWVKIGCVASLVVCAYPILRHNDLAPTEIISNITSKISPEREISYKVRLLNEGQLLAKAEQKPWFGWGAWGRNRLHDKWTGQDISATDGGWIIYFGVYGWFGYLSLYGLLAVSLFQAHAAMGKEVTRENIIRGGLALLLTVNIVDSIPNSIQEWLVFLLAGSLASASRVRKRAPKRMIPPQAAAQEPALAK